MMDRAGVDQALGLDAEQSDARAIQVETGIQRQGLRVQRRGQVNRFGDRADPADGLEIGEANLDANRAGDQVAGA